MPVNSLYSTVCMYVSVTTANVSTKLLDYNLAIYYDHKADGTEAILWLVKHRLCSQQCPHKRLCTCLSNSAI